MPETRGASRSTIWVITTSYPVDEGDPSGHFVQAEVRELELAGHSVTVLKPRAGGAFGWPGAATRLRSRPWRALDAAGFVASAAMRVRLGKPSRIIAHWAIPGAFPIAVASDLDGIELEVVSHGGDVRLLRALPARVRSGLVRRIADRASRWRFVSESLLEELTSSLAHDDAQRVRAIAVVQPSPITMPNVEESVRARRTALGSRRLYVTAGRLVPSKRVDKVIDYVATERHEQAPVLIVLGDGPQRDCLQEQAQRWGIDARFLGKTPRTEALSWIGAADELVHASQAEGFSTVLREAEHLGVKITLL